jgi:enoyl-CoA hydratase/carnithine racemase
VPATEVARRLGHSVAVLLKVYANCIDGQEAAANGRIQSALTDSHETLAPAADGTDPTAADPAGQARDSCSDEEL